MAPFVTQPNMQPSHDAQPNVQPTHDTQPNVQPTHDAQPNVQSTHDAQPPTTTSEAVGSASADPAESANGDDSASDTTHYSLLPNPTTTMNRDMLLMVVIIHQVMLLAMINSKITD